MKIQADATEWSRKSDKATSSCQSTQNSAENAARRVSYADEDVMSVVIADTPRRRFVRGSDDVFFRHNAAALDCVAADTIPKKIPRSDQSLP